MSYHMRGSILFIALMCLFSNARAEVSVSPAEVYAQILQIDAETELVKNHFNMDKKPVEVIDIVADIEPRHVWQKCYMLQMKLMVFRRKHQLNTIAPVDEEPSERVNFNGVWAQTQRTLTTIRVIRKMLGIQGETTTPMQIAGKSSLDMFNKLTHIEAEWDVLAGSGFDATYAFDQTLRLNEDVDLVLRQLGIFDNAVPPVKNPHGTPVDSLAQAFLVLEQVQRLQKLAGLRIANLSAFHKTEKVTPADVFNLVSLTLADLQQIKARVGLTHAITPPASYHIGKKPADVGQLLGYITRKLALIEHL
jgi:hypothetical protein